MWDSGCFTAVVLELPSSTFLNDIHGELLIRITVYLITVDHSNDLLW